MTQVNLLPWREHARQANLTRFAVLLAACVGLTLLIILLIHIDSSRSIHAQLRRNAFLQATITEKQTELTALQDKKTKQINLISQLHFLSDLRKTSFQAVFLLNQLAATVPTNVTLDKVLREGSSVTLSGSAQSDSQVTQFMKNMGAIPGFGQPVLTEITTQSSANGELRYFQLKVHMKDS